MTIPGTLYKDIADSLNDSLFYESQAYSEINNTKAYVSDLDSTFGLEVSDLNDAVKNLSKSISRRVATPQSIDKIIYNLQKTIMSYGYSDIDSYLAEEGITVKSLFAERSAYLGYTISPEYISDGPIPVPPPVPPFDLRAAIENATSGETIQIPDGTFLIDPTTPISTADNITIEGNGASSIIRVMDGIGDYVSVFGGLYTGSTPLIGLTLKNFTLDLNPSGYGGIPVQGNVYTAAIGLLAWMNEDVTVDGVHLIYGGSVGIDLNAVTSVSKNATIKNCTLDRYQPIGASAFDHAGIYIEGYNHLITNNTVTNRSVNTGVSNHGYGSGIETHGGSSVITNNTIYGFQAGINVVSSGTNETRKPSGDMLIQNNSITNCGFPILIWPRAGVTLKNVTINDNYLNPGSAWSSNVWAAGIAINTGSGLEGTCEDISSTYNTIQFNVNDSRSLQSDRSGAITYVNPVGTIINATELHNNVIHLPSGLQPFLPISPVYNKIGTKKLRVMTAANKAEYPWSIYSPAGINTIFEKWDVSVPTMAVSEVDNHWRPWAQEARNNGLLVAFYINYWGAYGERDFPTYIRYVDYLGQEWYNKPCPTDPLLWSNYIGKMVDNLSKFTNFGTGGFDSTLHPDAIILDQEMEIASGDSRNPAGWIDRNDYTSPCFCSSCIASFSAYKGFDVGDRVNIQNNYFAEYNLYQRNLIAGYTRTIRDSIYPTVALGSLRLEGSHLMELWHPGREIAPGFTSKGNIPAYDGVAVGLGNVYTPAISFSEHTYLGHTPDLELPGADYTQYITDDATQYTSYGANVLSVYGVQFVAFGPNNLASYAKSLATASGSSGYWLFAGYTFESWFINNPAYATGVPAYYSEVNHYNGIAGVWELRGSPLTAYMSQLGITYPA